MKYEVFKNGEKVEVLENVTVERKPSWVVTRPTDPFSLGFRVFANGTFEVKEVE